MIHLFGFKAITISKYSFACSSSSNRTFCIDGNSSHASRITQEGKEALDLGSVYAISRTESFFPQPKWFWYPLATATLYTHKIVLYLLRSYYRDNPTTAQPRMLKREDRKMWIVIRHQFHFVSAFMQRRLWKIQLSLVIKSNSNNLICVHLITLAPIQMCGPNKAEWII